MVYNREAGELGMFLGPFGRTHLGSLLIGANVGMFGTHFYLFGIHVEAILCWVRKALFWPSLLLEYPFGEKGGVYW